MRLRKALVVSEVALAVILVASAGLLVRTLAKLQAVDVGFQVERILTVSMDVTTGPLRGRGNAARFLEELIPRVVALPGVHSVGAATGMPLEAGSAGQAITPEDRPPMLAAASPQVAQSAVSPGYFTTIGIALVKGRGCTEADTADATLVALLNETAARRYWPSEDPVGKRFAMGSRERFGFFRAPSTPGAIEWREIIGVVADIRSAGFGADIQPEVYYCYKQFPIYEPQLFVRAATDPVALAPAIRREIAAVSNRAVVVRFRTMEDVAGQSLTNQRLRAALVGSFSALALALGMLGIYGVLSYTVGQRTREIGIRMALGADRSQVSRMIVGQAFRLTAAGILLGLFGAFAAARWIASLLFGVQPLDALTFVGTCLLMLSAAILASSAPAWRATRIDPAVALRTE
jgi:putative ABC transport system permease protein